MLTPRGAFVEHYEPNQASRFLGMLRQRLAHDFGDLGQLIGRIEQFKLMIRKFRGQSGGEVSDKMHQATFQADTHDENVGDHLALHTGTMGHLRQDGR